MGVKSLCYESDSDFKRLLSVVDHVKLNFHIKEAPVQRMVSWNLLLFSTLKEVLRGGEK